MTPSFLSQARFARFAPRKVGQVLDLVRGKTVAEAYRLLQFTPKAAATLVGKTIRAAAAAAGPRADAAGLLVRVAYIGQGPTLKRMRASAMGRGVMVRLRSSHLTIGLDPVGKPLGAGRPVTTGRG